MHMTTSGALLIPAKETWKNILWNGWLPGSMAYLKLKYECLQFREEQNYRNTPLERYISNSRWKELLAVEIDSGRSAILIPKLKA